jgi:hypothetical protein
MRASMRSRVQLRPLKGDISEHDLHIVDAAAVVDQRNRCCRSRRRLV